jgi:NADH-quinone oxidoreductase subunit N
VTATVFLASLAGIPPLGGWIAKFGAFQALLTSGSGWGYGLAVIGAVNSVIAFGYYGVVMREIWMKPAPYGDTTPIRTPASIGLALGISTVATLVLGVLPGVAMYLGDLARITGAFGS